MAEDVTDELRDEPVEPDILTSDLVYEGKVWDLRSDTFRYNGSEIVRQYVDHPGAVAIVALDEQDRVLLIQQYRHPIRQRDWELPAGLLDVAGESPVDAARRELAEEVDLEATSWVPLVSMFTSPGGSDEVVRLFLARDLSRLEAFAREDEEADIRMAWVPLEDVVTAVLEGRIRNGIVMAGVFAAAERLRRVGAES